MDRRKFIKKHNAGGDKCRNTRVAAEVETNTLKGGKKMKILVITGSPRKNGNSNTLADNFIKGAEAAGHIVARFDSAFKTVHPCIACDKCGTSGECVFKDDFEFVKNNIIDADAVVFATPMYYFGISAQIKSVIDRFYSINGQISRPKKAVLLLTYADISPKEAEPIVSHYESMIRYLNWTDAGKVIALGVWTAGSVKETKFPQQAYELGKNL